MGNDGLRLSGGCVRDGLSVSRQTLFCDAGETATGQEEAEAGDRDKDREKDSGGRTRD